MDRTDNYIKDGRLKDVLILCSFYHDPLHGSLLRSKRYKTHIHNLQPDDSYESFDLKPAWLQTAKLLIAVLT